MRQKYNGGLAFPRASEFFDEQGMTLRQWYAGQALVGVIVASRGGWPPQNVAEECAMYADALIAELDKET